MSVTHRILVPFELPDADEVPPVLVDTLAAMEVVLLGHYGLPEQTPPSVASDQFEDDAQAEFNDIARRFEETGVSVTTRLVFGKARKKMINRVALEEDCDVILTPGDADAIAEVLVPLRGEANFDRILSFVGELLTATGASVTLFHTSEESDRLPGEKIPLAAYVLNSGVPIEPAKFDGFGAKGAGGIVTAAAFVFVFVSYAGVIKIASVAEEIENPNRNLPLGILISMGAMMVLYTLVVTAVVGLNDSEVLSTSGLGGGPSLTPMADGAGQLFEEIGVVVIAVVAILALTSMANAGVLASSRFPLAMSRDSLAPGGLTRVSERFQTTRNAIIVTGVLLLALIAFVPVVELAKLASAFQILVFSIVNVALIMFRTSGVESYQPSFRSPGYPLVQIFGVVGSFGPLTQMGTLPILGAAGIIVGGIAWYLVYGRSRTDREGALGVIIDRRGEEIESMPVRSPRQDRLRSEHSPALTPSGDDRIRMV